MHVCLNQQITSLSDGGDTVRDLHLYLNPHAEHLLDWFHVAMRLTVLQQTAKGLPDKTSDEEEDYPLHDPVVRGLERLKWFLWHGNVYKALQVVQSVEMDLDVAVATSGHGTARKLLKAVEEFQEIIPQIGRARKFAPEPVRVLPPQRDRGSVHAGVGILHLPFFQQTSAHAEFPQFSADRGLAEECGSVSACQGVPAHPVGHFQGTHRHRGQCRAWPRLGPLT